MESRTYRLKVSGPWWACVRGQCTSQGQGCKATNYHIYYQEDIIEEQFDWSISSSSLFLGGLQVKYELPLPLPSNPI